MKGSKSNSKTNNKAPREILKASVLRLATRLDRLGQKLSKPPTILSEPVMWQVDGTAVPVQQAAARAASILKDIAIQISTLPADWKPTPGKRGRPVVVLEPGDTVQIREKHLKLYTDLLDKTVTDNFIVDAVAGELVGLTGGAMLLYVPKNHLRKVTK